MRYSLVVKQANSSNERPSGARQGDDRRMVDRGLLELGYHLGIIVIVRVGRREDVQG
jgi:hypothetical protein